MRFIASILALALLGGVLAASAADQAALPERLRVCAAVPDTARRLACYDALAAALDAPRKREPPRWRTSLAGERPEDAGAVVLSTLSTQGAGPAERPMRLVISCRPEREPLVGINWYLHVGTQQVPVHLAIDGQAPVQRLWSVTSDGTTTVELWNSPAIVRALLHARSLLAQLVLPDDQVVTATFTVAGLDEAIRPHRAACGLGTDGG